MSVVIERVREPTEDVRLLIGELDAECGCKYPPENRHGLNIAKLFAPGVLFFIARLDGQPAGCGGIALGDGCDFAEVKRMYVRPAMRRKNVARAIIDRLAAEARQRGVNRLTLETGDLQAEALKFYPRVGFTKCAIFGHYATLPPEATRHSVFFEKRI